MLDDLPLVDHHVHGVVTGRLDREAFESLITESDRPMPSFESQLGYAIRRFCSPLLGLEPHASIDSYLSARAARSEPALSQLFLRAAGVSDFLVDTGYLGNMSELGALSAARTHEIVRLETELEYVAAHESSASAVPDAFLERLESRTRSAVGLKSIVAYRHGFHFDPSEPTRAEVRAALDRWYRTTSGRFPAGPSRVTDPVLLRWLLWSGVRRGLPLQLHTGFGDPDLNLRTADPLLLTDWLRLIEPTATPVVLLHCYPFHREAGYLAHVFPQVHLDVGLTTMYVGSRAPSVLAESLELAPFTKLLYSSDAAGPPELHYLGAAVWRQALAAVLDNFVANGDWSVPDADRVATLWGRENALRLYSLD
jgi:predicted TIM-barrel fold metal-dependent hydrolase